MFSHERFNDMKTMEVIKEQTKITNRKLVLIEIITMCSAAACAHK